MTNGKKLRLIQVAKEFNVGLNTITDFLQKKGIKSDGSPNTPVEPDVYAVLEKEFGSNRGAGSERESIRERIAQKQATVTLDEARRQAREEEQEIVIKSRIISVQDEIPHPKILGKIDLDPKTKVPVLAPRPAAPAPQAASAAPAASRTEAPAVPAAGEAQPAAAAETAPAAPRTEAPAAAEAEAAARTAQAAPAETEAPAPTAEAPKDNIFRPNTTVLTGPQVLGTMDVSGFVPGGRHKRKRLQEKKVDVNKAQQQQKGQGGGKPAQGANAAGGRGGQHPNQPKPGEGRRSKNKNNKPKPVVRPEVSDEEVSKQVKDTLARLTSKGAKSKSAKYRKDKREAVAERMNEEFEREEQERSILKVTEFVTVSELATMMNVPVTEVITACMNLGLMVSINQRLDAEALVVVAEEFGFKTEFVSVDIQEAINDDDEADAPEDLVPRPPIVTVMGHVDHGKTSLLDNIRKTNVIEGEAGGITQHIGAYSVELNGQKITFLDTPGHEAFTAMRARGAKITDVAIIIVAADDSVMPQTIEAINHAQAAGVPMVFAINKIDKPQANPDHIKEQLSQMNYLVESWGGKYQDQEISAKQGLNLDKLLEKVLLEAEMLDLKANPNKRAVGTVIESTLDKGRGYVSTILVQSGTLRVGDVILSGVHTGRVKAMFNENGKKVTEAGPSTPVQVLGLNGAPQAGDTFNVMEDDRSAREIANKRSQLQRMQGIMTQKHVTLDEIGRRIAIGSFKELNIIVKGDVDGSVEAMSGSLIKLSKESVQVNVIHAAVGQISESDVLLAAASNAIIVGFQVRPSAAARRVAEKEEIEIRLYSIIYDAINDIKDAIEGMLEPVTKEEIVCSVEVLEIFKITKVGTVAGCVVREGKLQRTTPIRVIRDGIVIYTGKLGSLKRFKDDVKEVSAGQDCGLNIESFNDIRIGDIVEGYEQVEVKRK
ncbi:translation initiation factor IF-2 [Alistipes sp. CHKCI003]|uniref:translation initiation factor IF-2 n=1 Tax=Alistipes sp. CHKCI003 TaxID=1780376 RepID=UPI0007A923F4|nr:translation initiation factor IF-2 [Alistipes sp. CHKCI003]CVI65546.1 Translation initiation factor IF-2 [Alistipes sp. CHKCI003]